jgi:hypothetical protein
MNNKSNNERCNNVYEILLHAKENNLKISDSCIELGYGTTYVRDFFQRNFLYTNLNSKKISKQFHDELKNLHETLTSKKVKENNNSISETGESSDSLDITYKNLLNILDYSINNNKSITETELILGFYTSYFTKRKNTLQKYLVNGKFNTKLYSILEGLHNNYLESRHISKIDNQDIEKSFDERSKTDVIRNSEGLIVKYTYNILVRDEKDFIGELTREQMETIVSNYPYVTQKNCSAYFPYLTFVEFKKILRAFKITKDSLFPQHLLEELDENTLAELALKAKEKAGLKKFVELKPIVIEKQLREVQEELFKLKEEKDFVVNAIKDVLKLDINTIHSNYFNYQETDTDKGLFIWLADTHIGSCNKGALYSKPYNKDVYYDRLKQILVEIKDQSNLYKRFDKVTVGSLGDCLNSVNGYTTRGGHQLPENMNPKEQFQVYVESMIWFIDEIYKMNITNNIEFVSVEGGNHDGYFYHAANQSLRYLFELKYPKLKFTLFEKEIDSISYGETELIILHGKDTKNQKHGFPKTLDIKTELFFDNYIKMNKIKKDNILVVKGDLHCYASEYSKNNGFKYINVPSVYGGSGWIDSNFGKTQPATIFHIVDKHNGKMIEGYIELN